MTLTVLQNDSPEMWNLLQCIAKILIMNSERRIDMVTEQLMEAIKRNEAIIAGGALLSGIKNERIRDLDIYVHLNNSQSLVNELALLGFLPGYSHSTPVYDKSFMLRNNVIGRLVYSTRSISYMEIMLVKDNTSLENVVENFDLTFCKIWSDGEKIYSHHMDDVTSKSGKLGEDYFKALLEGNNFTIERLNKYKKRGYTVEYPNINTSNTVYKKHSKKVVSKEEWVIMYILKNLKTFVKNAMVNKEFYISFEVYALSVLETETDPMQRFNKLLEIVNTIYEPSFDDEEDFTLPQAIYGLIMFNIYGYVELCDWPSTKYLEYFDEFNIKIVPGGPSHGYNGEQWNFCNWRFYEYLIDKLGEIDMYKLYETFSTVYPTLQIAKEPIRPPVSAAERARQMQEQMRLARERFGEGTEIEETVEEATGTYRTTRGDEIPARCFSIIDAGEINSNTWENEEGNVFIIVEFGPEQSPEVLCTSVDEIKMIVNDSSKLMYRCGGFRGSLAGRYNWVDDYRTLDGPYDLWVDNVDRSVKYVPFTYGFEGTTALMAYLPMKDVNTIISIAENSTEVPSVIIRFVDTITHTMDVKNAETEPSYRQYIGANHCQYGSAISVFELQNVDMNVEDSNITPSTPLLSPLPPRRPSTPLPPPIRRRNSSSDDDSVISDNEFVFDED